MTGCPLIAPGDKLKSLLLLPIVSLDSQYPSPPDYPQTLLFLPPHHPHRSASSESWNKQAYSIYTVLENAQVIRAGGSLVCAVTGMSGSVKPLKRLPVYGLCVCLLASVW